MSYNTFGRIFRLTTFGESHGPAVGCVIDGAPSGIKLTASDIQIYLDKRKPGLNRFTTQRREEDKVEILSGVFEARTLGTPICLIVYNKDSKSKDYEEIKDKFRPGHGDYTYTEKYGFTDYRGGGRSSARETLARVAAGAIARKIIDKKIKINGYLHSIGELSVSDIDLKQVDRNHFFSPDKKVIPIWEKYIDQLRREGDSIGAIIEVVVGSMPVGLGEPIYQKLEASIAAAMMSINAVKGVEIGCGFALSRMRGSKAADQMEYDKKSKEVRFLSNHNGGTLAGISSGQDLVIRVAIKPTSSIRTELKTIDKYKKPTKISVKGRHDPCVGIRAVPVVEAMVACVLADLSLLHRIWQK